MTSLRTQWGVDLLKIEQDFSERQKKNLLAAAEEYLDKDWLVLTDDKLILTIKGKLYADKIASELFIIENGFQE